MGKHIHTYLKIFLKYKVPYPGSAGRDVEETLVHSVHCPTLTLLDDVVGSRPPLRSSQAGGQEATGHEAARGARGVR